MDGFIYYNATSGNVSNTEAEGYEAFVSAKQIVEKEAVTDEACKEIISLCDEICLNESRLRYVTRMWTLCTILSAVTIVCMAMGVMDRWITACILGCAVVVSGALTFLHSLDAVTIKKTQIDRKNGKDEKYEQLQGCVKKAMRQRSIRKKAKVAAE